MVKIYGSPVHCTDALLNLDLFIYLILLDLNRNEIHCLTSVLNTF